MWDFLPENFGLSSRVSSSGLYRPLLSPIDVWLNGLNPSNNAPLASYELSPILCLLIICCQLGSWMPLSIGVNRDLILGRGVRGVVVFGERGQGGRRGGRRGVVGDRGRVVR